MAPSVPVHCRGCADSGLGIMRSQKTCSLQDDTVLSNGEAQTPGALGPEKPELKEPNLANGSVGWREGRGTFNSAEDC